MRKRRLDAKAVDPAMRTKEARALMTAFLDLTAGRVRMAEDYRELTGKSVTMLDVVINLHVFLWRDQGGTRQQKLIETLHAPRRTIRDSLGRLEEMEFICRASNGCYFPMERTGVVTNGSFKRTLSEIDRLCSAYAEYRKKHPKQ